MVIIKDFVFLFINYFVCYIPSRKIRSLFYFFMSSGQISLKANIGFNVKILDIRNVSIDDFSNVGFGSLIDGRGGSVKIDKNVDIAPQVNIWTLQHDLKCKLHSSIGADVRISSYVWVGNRAIILPGTEIASSSTIGAGTVFKGFLKPGKVAVGQSVRLLNKEIAVREGFVLRPIRRFR